MEKFSSANYHYYVIPTEGGKTDNEKNRKKGLWQSISDGVQFWKISSVWSQAQNNPNYVSVYHKEEEEEENLFIFWL